ncbi:cytochrome P450 [Aspergillus saccharolyticus JOP 1030-1]|uniref:Cytochrome P450 n=1 Tax=Aspergillus saccharolyticus JOP 1030-1 TaxID=1450539 RepID=A0A319AAV5_9EURO|nr:cytochrome P450 [Aspergillus saccharolyticus JOP 1030-1]PYH44072.1 cytochrome P450 [Aspergillus saccharolyticus JOP 1030-1]
MFGASLDERVSQTVKRCSTIFLTIQEERLWVVYAASQSTLSVKLHTRKPPPPVSPIMSRRSARRGNLYVFTFAGYQTTANTRGFTVTLLSLDPEWQDWIHEELHNLPADHSNWPYEEVYFRSKDHFEVLLHFTLVLHSTRAVLESQQLVSETGTYYFQPPVMVTVSAVAIHFDERNLRLDVAAFKPSRWIGDETGRVKVPPKVTFLPWSGGPRICPGVKIAQCEPIPVDGPADLGALR